MIELLCFAALLVSQVDDTTSDSQDRLRRDFRDPPAQYRPLIIAHAQPLRDPDATQWIEIRRAGGAVLDAGVKPGSENLGNEPWNNPTYLDDARQFERLRKTIDQLRSQDRCVWLYDELGYPSGSAGGRVLAGHPEFQVEVVGCRTYRIVAGQTAEITPKQRQTIACCALPIQDGQLVLDDAGRGLDLEGWL